MSGILMTFFVGQTVTIIPVNGGISSGAVGSITFGG